MTAQRGPLAFPEPTQLEVPDLEFRAEGRSNQMLEERAGRKGGT